MITIARYSCYCCTKLNNGLYNRANNNNKKLPITTSTSSKSIMATNKVQQQQQQNKRIRKRKVLSKPLHPIITTKDKLRSLIETNRMIHKKSSDNNLTTLVAPAAELLDLASSRLSWVRNKVYQYWNPDYNEEVGIRSTTTRISTAANDAATATSSSSSNSSAADGGDATTTFQIRTYRGNGIIMDTRWWIWNILFALLPAICITLYCELRGKYVIQRYHRQNEIRELQKIIPEQEFTIELANAIIDAREKDVELEYQNRTGDLDEEFVKYFLSKLQLLYSYSRDTIQQMLDGFVFDNTINQATDDSRVDVVLDTNMTSSNQQPQGTTTITTANNLHATEPSDSQQSKMTVNNTSVSNEAGPAITPTLTKQPTKVRTNDLSIEYLYQRLQQLEAQLQQQQQQQYNTTAPRDDDSIISQKVKPGMDDQEAIRILAQRMKDMGQSNIHNRYEIDAKEKWRKYIETTSTSNTTTTTTKETQQPDAQSESYLSKLQQVSLPLFHILFSGNANSNEEISNDERQDNEQSTVGQQNIHDHNKNSQVNPTYVPSVPSDSVQYDEAEKTPQTTSDTKQWWKSFWK